MPNLTELIMVTDAILMPLIGCGALLISKLSSREMARWAERQFLATLVVITLVTLRTVINCGDAWLIHTLTLSTMIMGALIIPNLESSVAT